MGPVGSGNVEEAKEEFEIGLLPRENSEVVITRLEFVGDERMGERC